MKRKTTFALALLVFTGAALWGVNWRLDHPPLSQADKEFRALVAGADEVRAKQWSCQKSACGENWLTQYKPLNAAQTRELIQHFRFSPSSKIKGLDSSQAVYFSLEFWRNGKILRRFVLFQSPQITEVGGDSFAYRQVNPRFNKALNRFLDAYLPQRLRP